MTENFHMPFKEIVKQRARFHNETSEPELPLLEKQAIVDEVLRGMPLHHVECKVQQTPNGREYLVTKGWARLSALFDFVDNKFPTWDARAMQEWQSNQQK